MKLACRRLGPIARAIGLCAAVAVIMIGLPPSGASAAARSDRTPATYSLSGGILTPGIGTASEYEALIYVYGNPTPVQTVTATGTLQTVLWSAAGLLAGEYTVVLHFTGPEDVPDTVAVNESGQPKCTDPGCTINLNQDTSLGNTQMLRGKEVYGTVIDDVTHQPLPGMLVTVYGYDGGGGYDSFVSKVVATTDAQGNYDIRDLPYSDCRLEFSDPTGAHAPQGFQGVAFEYLGDSDDVPSQTPLLADATLQRSTLIEGSLTVPGGDPADFAAGLVTVSLQYSYSSQPGGGPDGYSDTGLTQTLALVGGVAPFTFPSLPTLSYRLLFTYAGPKFQGTAMQYVPTSPEGSTIVQNATLTLGLTPTPPLVSGGVGDLNGDGNTDIVARDSSGTVWLYPGNGSAGLAPRQELATGLQSMNAFTSIVDPDRATALVTRDTSGALWMYSSVSAMGYYELIQLATGWQYMTTIEGVADFNGDGLPDLLARSSSGKVYIYPVDEATATLGSPEQIASGWQSMTAIVGVGDFDGDGYPDLLVRDSAGILWLYPGTGTGGLGARVQVGSGWQGLTIADVGDFNHDDHQDVLVRDVLGTLWLYPGNGVGGFMPRVQLGTGWQGLTIAGDGGDVVAPPTFVTLPQPMTLPEFVTSSVPEDHAPAWAEVSSAPASTTVSTAELTQLELSGLRDLHVSAR